MHNDCAKTCAMRASYRLWRKPSAVFSDNFCTFSRNNFDQVQIDRDSPMRTRRETLVAPEGGGVYSSSGNATLVLSNTTVVDSHASASGSGDNALAWGGGVG